MLLALIYITFVFTTLTNAEKTSKVHLQAMSSAEIDNLELHNQGRNPFEPSHDRMFDDGVKSRPKSLPIVENDKPEPSTASAPLTSLKNKNPLPLSHRPLPLPPSVLTDEERDLENMLNLKEIRFMTDETTSTTQALPKKIVESDGVKPRQIRETDNGTLSEDKHGGRPLILKSTDNEEEADTAPPEVVDPSILIKAEEDFLKQLSQAKVLKSGGGSAHQGGNVRNFVDFEEALKVTVPYNAEKDSPKKH